MFWNKNTFLRQNFFWKFRLKMYLPSYEKIKDTKTCCLRKFRFKVEFKYC